MGPSRVTSTGSAIFQRNLHHRNELDYILSTTPAKIPRGHWNVNEVL